jgi:signal peptidase
MKKKLLQISAYGKSMYPFFQSGDTLFIKPIALKQLSVNDFLTFQKGNIFITHRVIYIPPTETYVITKGDMNLQTDGKVKPEKIIGKVIEIKRNNKKY